MVETITKKTKGKAKERPKDAQPARTKEGRKLFLLMVGNYLTHSLSNVAIMQIMRFNSIRMSRINISCQHNLPLYNKS
jgi:hypothetical protein